MGMYASWREKIIFRKNEWAYSKIGPLNPGVGQGLMITCDKVVWVWYRLLVSSPVIRVSLPWLMRLPKRGFMTTEFLLEGLSLGR